MRLAIAVIVLSFIAPCWAEQPRRFERLPRVEQIESGETPMEKLTDRQLIALMLDLARRLEFDRSQHNGRPGPDAAWLNKWLDKTADALRNRGYAAGDDEIIEVP